MKIINIVTTVCVIDGCQVWLLNQIPGPKAIPVLGNALYFNVDATELFQRVLKVTECGEVSRMWMVHNPFCFLSSAKTAEVVAQFPGTC
ncbi:cytochrome P450 4c3-like [Cherax quadricarinatus]|uniref:cytochrome P450 4c3-like n=1 Tax=Cherax quadricarinatus TaxID=27406 RepID=UPI00387E35BD